MPLKLHHDDVPTINLTPMIDIVFQLIIFFMVGARFSEMENKIDLQVPKVSSSSTLPQSPEKYIVNIHRDGKLTLNKVEVTLANITSQLAAARAQKGAVTVTVRGDGQGNVQQLASVLAAVRDAGVEDIGLSVRVANVARKGT
jgi:biopolymer transport protein ExbD